MSVLLPLQVCLTPKLLPPKLYPQGGREKAGQTSREATAACSGIGKRERETGRRQMQMGRREREV